MILLRSLPANCLRTSPILSWCQKAEDVRLADDRNQSREVVLESNFVRLELDLTAALMIAYVDADAPSEQKIVVLEMIGD